jgi:hypothetical protein
MIAMEQGAKNTKRAMNEANPIVPPAFFLIKHLVLMG